MGCEWGGFTLLSIGTGVTSRSHKRREIYLIPKRLSAYQEGFCSVELVTLLAVWLVTSCYKQRSDPCHNRFVSSINNHKNGCDMKSCKRTYLERRVLQTEPHISTNLQDTMLRNLKMHHPNN